MLAYDSTGSFVAVLLLLQISKKAIDSQKKRKPSDVGNDVTMWYIPKIEIEIQKAPRSHDSDPLELEVKGLNKDSTFRIAPGKIPPLFA